MSQSKFKVGDLVKSRKNHHYLGIVKNELGMVLAIDDAGEDGFILDVGFLWNHKEGFIYDVGMVEKDVKKVGTKIKRKRIGKLKVGDQIVVEEENSFGEFSADTELNPEVHTIESIDFDENNWVRVFSGKNFKLVIDEDDYFDKVPVVV